MDLLVSAVKGHVVGRLGSGRPGTKNTQLGVRFDPELGENEWDEDEVVVIPAAEYAQFRRYYDKALANGALKKRDPADLKAWEKTQAERSKAEGELLAKARELELAEGKKAAEVIEKRDADEREARKKVLLEAKAKIEQLKAGRAEEPSRSGTRPKPSKEGP